MAGEFAGWLIAVFVCWSWCLVVGFVGVFIVLMVSACAVWLVGVVVC